MALSIYNTKYCHLHAKQDIVSCDMHIPMHIKVGRCDGEKLHAMTSLLTNSDDRGERVQRWLGVVFQDGGNTATWPNQV